MLFQLKPNCGEHSQNGRTYCARDVVESDIDLASKFRGKFDRVDDASTASKGKPSAERKRKSK